MRKFLVTAFLFGSILSAAAQTDTSTLFQRGIAQYQNRQYDHALELLIAAAKADPDSAEILVHIGDVYDEIDDSINAIKYYNLAVERDYESKLAYYHRAAEYERFQMFEAAYQDYYQALKLDLENERLPSNRDVYYDFGLLLIYMSKFDDALTAFEQVIMIDPDHYDAHYQLAMAYTNLSDFDAVAAALTECIRIDAQNGNAFYLRAINHAGSGDLESACEDFETAKELGHPRAEAGLKDLCGSE